MNNKDIVKLFIETLSGTVRETPSDYMITCPFHKDGKERRPSCGVNKETGVFHCFACGESGSIESFIGRCLGGDWRDGEDWINDNFVITDIEHRKPIVIEASRAVQKKEKRYVDERSLEQYRVLHPYMYQRKMNDCVIDIFDVGYDKASDCLTFPVRDTTGGCLFVARRSVSSKWYNYPSGAEKPLYGLWECLREYPWQTKVYITESMINCITLWKYGVACIALNGTGSEEQYRLLEQTPYREIVLCLDPDDAGRKGMEKSKRMCVESY